jgi:hypothetical protein
VQATPEGLRRFGKQVELITGEPFSDAMDVRFFCKSPTGERCCAVALSYVEEFHTKCLVLHAACMACIVTSHCPVCVYSAAPQPHVHWMACWKHVV